MTCVEKRHVNHRMGSMLHHRFPNGFADLFMDEADREVSTLTDRAFRSLCIGDDAIYSDEFLHGYSPFSCHKPLAGEPFKKNHQKESKKPGQHRHDKGNAKQQRNSDMSSLLRALSAAEERCEGMLMRNGGTADSNGESWDKSALRSIQRELSEFSSDYENSLAGEQQRNSQSNGSSNKTERDGSLPSGKSTKVKNGKALVKLRKLNIKNFFLHSEFSPFQTWKDFNRFPFSQEDAVTDILSEDNTPKWYDLPFYKELTEAHRKNNLHIEGSSKESAPPAAPKPAPPPPPPKVLPKLCAGPAEKRCSSDVGNETAAPWRRNRSRAKSALPSNTAMSQPQEITSKGVDESVSLFKKEVKAVEEVSSAASTPFSICQLMTPVIVSRQPTETSEILSPSALDLPGRSHSAAKGTPELPVRRETYKSLASSILFNLKDNRKRVKSRYSPPKFKTLDPPEEGDQSPDSDDVINVDREGAASGLNTPAVPKEGQVILSPSLGPRDPSEVDPTRGKPSTDDYLMTTLLQNKCDGSSPQSNALKMLKSPMVRRQMYPSLNLYKKSSPVHDETSHLTIPVGADPSGEINDKKASLNFLPVKTQVSPIAQNTPRSDPTAISPVRDRLTTDEKGSPKVLKKTRHAARELEEQPAPQKTTSAMDVIRAAKEAISAAKSKARSRNHTETEALRKKEAAAKVSNEAFNSSLEGLQTEGKSVFSESRKEETAEKTSHNRKEPPPVPKRNFTKSDLQLDKKSKKDSDKGRDKDLEDAKPHLAGKDPEYVLKQGKGKHAFSSRLNNYIKHQRCAEKDDKQAEEGKESNSNVEEKRRAGDEIMSLGDMKEGGHIANDLQALKELERARLGDGTSESDKSKQDIKSITEEAKAKNDLISRELRNIKRGMLSMRGNTSAKRDLFAKREQELRKQETLGKSDANIIINKALINNNYDKAKMALEEVISERERRRNKSKERDGSLMSQNYLREKAPEEWTQPVETPNEGHVGEATDDQHNVDSSSKQKELREKLCGFKELNHIRQILSQTEPQADESQRLGRRTVRDRKEPNPKLRSTDTCETLSTDNNVTQHERSEENKDKVEKKLDTPKVPPRSKKTAQKRDENKEKHERGAVATKDAKGGGQDDLGESTGIRQPTHETEVAMSDSTSGWETSDALSKRESDDAMFSSPKPTASDTNFNNFLLQTGCNSDDFPDKHGNSKTPERSTMEQEASLVPDHTILKDDSPSKGEKVEEELDLVGGEDNNVEVEAAFESPRNFLLSPILQVNGVALPQSPPDRISVSSKSSYFSADSTLHGRSTETESNSYLSFETLTGDVEEVDEEGSSFSQNDSSRIEVEHCATSDPEGEPEEPAQVARCQEESQVQTTRGDADGEKAPMNEPFSEENESTESSTNTFSPLLGMPALFKVKDNSVKLKKALHPWSPKSNSSERENEENEAITNLDLALKSHTSAGDTLMSENIGPIEHLPNFSPTPQHAKNTNKPQFGDFLTVPQEDDGFSGSSPSSEGVESFTASTAETLSDAAGNNDVSAECDGTKAPSERSGSTCSGNDSQTGLPKPPAVLPKSEKAVLKAIKLTNRRMKKEEAQKVSSKSSQGGEKSKADRQPTDRRSDDAKPSKSSERRHREKMDQYHSDRHNKGEIDKQVTERESHHNRERTNQRTQRRSRESAEMNDHDTEKRHSAETERQGRSSDREVPKGKDQRDYSAERVISNIPVYKAHVEERSKSDRPYNRSQSIDRHMEGKVERRLSADVSPGFDPRSERIEKSIPDELQQRGRAKDKPRRDHLLRRSHSTDAQCPDVRHPPAMNPRFSRQSSFEHAIVARSFPVAQRKLLQDPDSGQYFFVDLPVQVKTKTFYDPETRSYVQLPVQPPDGGFPKPSPMEVLTQPLVVYHSFVPVPLSPMAHQTAIQASQAEAQECERRRLERMRQLQCKEGQPYLETAYGQHDRLVGEFLGTEELGCPS